MIVMEGTELITSWNWFWYSEILVGERNKRSGIVLDELKHILISREWK